jgi:cytochrome c oxidase subunit 1
VLIGGGIFPLVGAIYYWFPKMTGRMMSERAGYWNFWLLFVGFNLTFFPLHHAGFQGMARRRYTYLPEEGLGDLNLLATVGAAILGLGVLVFLLNLLWSRRRGAFAGPNPWGGGTLEWATSSPPPRYGFQHPPTVQAREPVWENRPDAAVVTGLSADKRQILCTSVLDATPEHRYDMAGDSIWPLAVALSTGALLIGGMFHPWAVPPACVLITIFLYIWFWVSGGRKDKSGATNAAND